MLGRQLLHGGHSHEGEGTIESGAQTVKIIAIFIVPLCTFVGALLPLYAKWIRESQSLLSYSSVLAGGIILGFGFLHALPDAVESFAPYVDNINGFPLIYALALFSFFLVMLIEKKLISYMHGLKKQSTLNPKSNEITAMEASPTSDTEMEHHLHHHHDHAHHFHTHDVVDGPNIMPYILTAGLAFHSIFEGLAIGLQSTVEATILILVGIALHKFAEAFAMGMNFMRAKLPLRRSLLLTSVFSIICPIGTAIGLGLGESLSGAANAIVSAILNGIAVGVFMYISILGVMLEEFTNDNDTVKKIGLALIGCVAMGSLNLIG